MQDGEQSLTLAEQQLPKVDGLSSYLTSSKKDDIVFFRMESPSQLENEYELGDVLGEGTFGVVYRGVKKKDGAKCAIKRILRERTYSASERSRLDREIAILRLVRHPGIIQLLAVAESPTILFIITELCEGKSLDKCLDALPENTGLEEHVAVEIVRQVTSALAYLHNRGIVHRDLKAGNIMFLHEVALDYRPLTSDTVSTQLPPVTANKPPKQREHLPMSVAPAPELRGPKSAGIINAKAVQPKGMKTYANSAGAVRDGVNTKLGQSCTSPNHHTAFLAHGPMKHSLPKKPSAPLITKLIDFGLAIEVRKNEEALDSQCGTLLYMAPEVLSGRSYTRQCDVWSLGILMYQLLTRRFPFTAHHEEQLLNEIRSFNTATALESLKDISCLARSCLSNALHTDPAYRYSAAELLLDPWVATDDRVSNPIENHFGACDGNQAQTVESIMDKPIVASTSKQDQLDLQQNRQRTSITSWMPSIGLGSQSGTHSTTNVLQLMKQYHKELNEQKPQ